MRSADRKNSVHKILDDAGAIVETGTPDAEGRVGVELTMHIRINPGRTGKPPVVQTELGPTTRHTPLEAVQHATEMIAELFARRGFKTDDLEIAYDVLGAMDKIRRQATRDA